MSVDVLARLEKWKFKHKARSVMICHDNGYGAASWEVDLKGEQNRYVNGVGGKFDGEDYSSDPPNMVRAGNDDWGTLEQVITAALDRWSQLYGDEV